MVTNDITDGTIDEIIGRIDGDSIPNLEGTNVSFYGLGTVGGEQATLNNSFSNRLAEIWTDLLTKESGATLLNTIKYSAGKGDFMYYNESSSDGYPMVSVVPTSDKNELIQYSWKQDSMGNKHQEASFSPIPLYSSALTFMPNSAILTDRNIAEQTINRYISAINEYIETNETGKLYVVGSIAKTSKNDSRESDTISKDRARSVAQILEYSGIPAERIEVIDAGTTPFSWRNAEEFPNGNEVDLEAQQKNRIVMIFGDCNSEMVAELRDNGYID